ncbi:hypothetical protein PR048_012256 [Dryococelus australis]|uniref:Uncharacterized protein n=1 Tax=Dryococelus australis TaxID=614101 RepID=A0ABQ9HNV4_9NEOP|nr:hypothetical protein PR048_012256 [Dryococelus australis]
MKKRRRLEYIQINNSESSDVLATADDVSIYGKLLQGHLYDIRMMLLQAIREEGLTVNPEEISWAKQHVYRLSSRFQKHCRQFVHRAEVASRPQQRSLQDSNRLLTVALRSKKNFKLAKRLDSTVMCILEPQMFVHWLLPQRVASVTPHLAVWHSLLVSLQVYYWLRVVQGVSNELRSNRKINFSVNVLNFTVVFALEPASFLHWLLHRCEDTPSLTEQHVSRAHNCEVFLYWRRATLGVSQKVWSNDKHTITVDEVRMEQHRKARAGEKGDHREKPANQWHHPPARFPHTKIRKRPRPKPNAFALGGMRDKVDFKRVYTKVTFANGSEFIRHALDDSAPIADLQGNKKRIPYCQMCGNTGATANEQTSEFIRHAFDVSAPIADLQGNKKQIPYCQMLDNTGVTANEQTSHALLYKGLLAGNAEVGNSGVCTVRAPRLRGWKWVVAGKPKRGRQLHGRHTIRLPRYMCEINAIDLTWAKMKCLNLENNTCEEFVTTLMLQITEDCSPVTSSDRENCLQLGAGKTGDPRENPPTSGIVRHDSHLRISCDPARDRTRSSLVGGGRDNRSATVSKNSTRESTNLDVARQQYTEHHENCWCSDPTSPLVFKECRCRNVRYHQAAEFPSVDVILRIAQNITKTAGVVILLRPLSSKNADVETLGITKQLNFLHDPTSPLVFKECRCRNVRYHQAAEFPSVDVILRIAQNITKTAGVVILLRPLSSKNADVETLGITKQLNYLQLT